MTENPTKVQDMYDTLKKAIHQGDLDSLRHLVSSGFDVNTSFYYYHESGGSFGPHGLVDHPTPLVMAIWENWIEGVEFLLKSGADVEKPDLRVSFYVARFLTTIRSPFS